MNRNYFYFLTFSAGLASFNFGYNIAVFNNLSPELNIQSFNIQFLCPAGAILGCLLACKISSVYGRRKCFYLLNTLNIIGSLLVTLIQTLAIYNEINNHSNKLEAIVFIGRIICGLSVGMASYVVPLYIREMSPSEIYARLGSINQFMITFGIFLAYCSVFIIRNNNHYLVFIIFLIPIIVSLVQIVVFLTIFNAETPTFLMSKNRMDEAASIMNELYFHNASATGSDDIFGSQLSIGYKAVDYKDLFTLKYFSNFKMGCILSILQQLTGINYLIYASSYYIRDLNGVDKYQSTCIIGFVNCLSGSFSVFLLKDRYKNFLQIGALGMSGCYLLILCLVFTEFEYFDQFYLACVLLFIIFFEFSIGPIMWIYCADVLTDKGISLTTALNWVGALVVGGVFSIDQVQEQFSYERNKGISNLYFFFMNLFYMSACLVIFYYSKYKILERRELLSSELRS